MKRARWFVLVWVVVPLLALLVGVAVLVALSAKTASGTAFLLASVTKWVPQLRIVQPEGPLFGVFKAQRIEWHDDAQHHVVLTNPNCSGVTLQRAAHTRSKMGVTMAQCRVDAVLVDWPSSAKSQVAPPLPTLQLPFALSVKALSIGAVQSPQLGSDHLQQVIGAVDLQSLGQQGVQHHIHLKQLQWQVWRMSGKLQVVPGNNIELHASLQASSDTGDADVQLDGPLRQLQAKGQVRIRGQSAVDDASPEVIEQRQALNVRAVMTPLNVWPVESVQVEANRLDLKRLNRQWPTSLLTGQVSVLPKQLSQQGLPARIEMSVQLNNEASGPWDAERIPVRKMQAALRLPVSGIQSADWLALWREGDVQAHLQLPTQGPSPGSIELSGHWHLDQRQHTALQARLTDVDTRALHTRAPALRLNGPVSVQGTPEQAWRLTGELTGQDRGQGLLPQAVKAQWQARWQPDKWWVDALKLQSAGAQAELKGQWQRQLDGRWQAQGDISLADVDPAVWMPWPRPSGDKAQATRLNGKSHWQIKGQGDQLTRLEGLQGSSEGQLQNSLLLGNGAALDFASQTESFCQPSRYQRHFAIAKKWAMDKPGWLGRCAGAGQGASACVVSVTALGCALWCARFGGAIDGADATVCACCWTLADHRPSPGRQTDRALARRAGQFARRACTMVAGQWPESQRHALAGKRFGRASPVG
jgi:translocation and assembly module TamB